MNTVKTRKFVTIVHDPELRALLNDFMSNHECEVESAKDGLDAFHKLAKNYFDLIITDMQMPGLAGVDLIPRLKHIQPWARVIVIPKRKIGRKERKILDAAADVCIENPFNISQLTTVVQELFPSAAGKRPSIDKKWNRESLSWQTV